MKYTNMVGYIPIVNNACSQHLALQSNNQHINISRNKKFTNIVNHRNHHMRWCINNMESIMLGKNVQFVISISFSSYSFYYSQQFINPNLMIFNSNDTVTAAETISWLFLQRFKSTKDCHTTMTSVRAFDIKAFLEWHWDQSAVLSSEESFSDLVELLLRQLKYIAWHKE